MPEFLQASFGHGEISPLFYGRVDTTMYASALRTARNVTIRQSGGASNRPGLSFVGPAKDHTGGQRLIPFRFKTTDQYMLEFGNLYMRVIRNDAHVTETPFTIAGATAANPIVISAAGHNFVNGDEIYIDAVVGMTRLNGRRFIATSVVAGVSFALTDQVTGANVNGTTYPAYVSGGSCARIYTLVMPYLKADLRALKYVQSADVMTLTHPSYQTIELGRVAHDNWTLTTPTFGPKISRPTGIAVAVGTAGTVTRRYQVTAVFSTGEESLTAIDGAPIAITGVTQANPGVVTAVNTLAFGDEVEVNSVAGMTEINGRRFKAVSPSGAQFQLQGEDTTSYTAYSAGGTANRTFVEVLDTPASTNTLTWAAVADAVSYNIYRADNGIYGLLAVTSKLSYADDKTVSPDTSVGPPTMANPFLFAGNFPGAAGYYQERRVLGGTLNNPDTSVYSQTGNEENLSSSLPLQADDAITATLTSLEVNDIRHYVPTKDLIIFTSGSEWRVNSGGSSSGFSAQTIDQVPQSAWGASHNKPIVVGVHILFVRENLASVRSMKYDLYIDGYDGEDLTTLATHIFGENVLVYDWGFATSPDPIAYVSRTDGQLATMTYNPDQQMTAWTRWDTQGKFEAVGILRHSLTEIDEAVYVTVRRIVNGNVVRYIERTHSRRFLDVRDCFFVDAGVSYDNPIAITGVTAANPVVVTAPAHGFANGTTVDIFDIEWATTFDNDGNEIVPNQLNGNRYLVAGATADTFQVTDTSGNPINGTGFAGYIEGGTVRQAVTTISGLDHLEGRSLAVLADGNVVSGMTVLNGSITLPRKFSRVHMGLSYISDIETLNIELPGTNINTMQGKFSKIAKAVVRFAKSRGLLIGPDSGNLVEMKQREFENMSDPTALLTGDKEIVFNPDWNTNGRIFLRQKYPLPMTILAVAPTVEIEDP